jgi:hydrogenase nickel incorporation protein HypA/HybF
VHELSIAMSIVEIATEYAEKDNSDKVLEIEIEVGDLSGVVIEALDFAMQSAVKMTICENAKWEIIRVKAVAKCNTTGKSYELNNLYSPCPYCKEYGHELIQGKELRVKSILVE